MSYEVEVEVLIFCIITPCRRSRFWFSEDRFASTFWWHV